MEHQKRKLKIAQQKTTTSELLIAHAQVTQLHTDSTVYFYSGNRGSNLSVNSGYGDQYSTLAPFSTVLWRGLSTPTLYFDSSVYYWDQTLKTKTTRIYNGFDNIDTQFYKSFGANGLLAAQRFETASYDAMQNVINAYHYIDTSQSAQGLFQKNKSLKTNYLPNTHTRLSDTSEGLTYKWVLTYNYDATGNMVSILRGDGNQLPIQFLEKDSFVYDAANRLVSYTNMSFTSGTWVTWIIDSFEYNGNNLQYTKNDEYQFSVGSVIHYRGINVLGPMQRIDTAYTYTIDANGISMPAAFGACSYNNNNHLTSYKGYSYNSSSGQWETNPGIIGRWYYAFKTNIDTLETSTAESFAQLFPNPVHNELNLKVQPGKGKVEIVLVNTSGQIVQQYQFTSSENIHLDVKALPNGTYVLSVLTNGQHAVLKFDKM